MMDTNMESSLAELINESDTVLNAGIQAHIDSQYYRGSSTTAPEWRLEKWELLRSWDYPPTAELNDIQVKINSGISELITEGQQQLSIYVQDCLNVKIRFPKE